MKRVTVLRSLAGIAGVAAPYAVAAATPPGVTVFAAASLREAFEAAAPAFTKLTRTPVTYVFGGSDMLLTQLAQGAPADVFASAAEAQMEAASARGLLAEPPRVFARNHLIVIVRKNNPARMTGVAGLATPGLKIVLAAASVPVGSYARAAFRTLNGKPGYPPDFDALVERNIVSNELDVKAVATKIALGEGDAGVVYATDVTPRIAARVARIPFPAGAAPTAVYPIAPVNGAANAAGARAFVAFITSPQGQTFLRARGFAAP
ncbi:MAG TPA: molybdate ABC transporter substrate-binding protein [Candidatus Elarobacter sp.]